MASGGRGGALLEDLESLRLKKPASPLALFRLAPDPLFLSEPYGPSLLASFVGHWRAFTESCLGPSVEERACGGREALALGLGGTGRGGGRCWARGEDAGLLLSLAGRLPREPKRRFFRFILDGLEEPELSPVLHQ